MSKPVYKINGTMDDSERKTIRLPSNPYKSADTNTVIAEALNQLIVSKCRSIQYFGLIV